MLEKDWPFKNLFDILIQLLSTRALRTTYLKL